MTNKESVLKMFSEKDMVFISHEEEKGLFENLNCAAREKILNSHIRLVVKLAREYADYGVDLEDLVSEGCIGLFRAIDRFDPKKGARFSYYCAFWIKQFIIKALADQSRTIRLPTAAVTEYLKILSYCRKYREENAEEPTLQSISKGIGVAAHRVAYIQEATRTCVSIDMPLQDCDNRTVGEVIEDEKNPSPSVTTERFDDIKILKKFISKLNRREQIVVNNRFGIISDEEETLAEIGKKLNITRERVRQIEEVAMEKLKSMFEMEKLDKKTKLS